MVAGWWWLVAAKVKGERQPGSPPTKSTVSMSGNREMSSIENNPHLGAPASLRSTPPGARSAAAAGAAPHGLDTLE